MEALEIVERDEFAKFINAHKELEAKPFESTKVASMMYVDDKGVTIAQAIYYGSGNPVYKIRKDYLADK